MGGGFFLVPVSSVERVVLAIGWLVSFGTSSAVAFFSSIMAVGGDGSTKGVMVIGGMWAVCIAASLCLSIWLARRGKLIRSILAGFIPVLLVFSAVLIVNA